LLPGFVLYAGFVYGFSGLYKSKWRFTSLPDLYNIMRAATVLAATLLALDYVMLAPNVYGTFFFGKITILLYWLLQIAFLSGPRVAYRYFRYTRTLQHAREGDSALALWSGAPPTPMCCCVRSRAVRSRKSGLSVSCRHPRRIVRKPSAESRCSAIPTTSKALSPISGIAAPT
jgi:hypothetical protein